LSDAEADMPIKDSTPIIDDARWSAVLARDRGLDGTFYCAVVTTGIYCRPSCSARPKRENVRAYPSRELARAAGYRACKRCKPDELA
jgi:AraC family transcriptional regulator, regulatory protein of adaptative response / methylated-DNA-[protein]-cysteine methyltransferase